MSMRLRSPRPTPPFFPLSLLRSPEGVTFTGNGPQDDAAAVSRLPAAARRRALTDIAAGKQRWMVDVSGCAGVSGGEGPAVRLCADAEAEDSVVGLASCEPLVNSSRGLAALIEGSRDAVSATVSAAGLQDCAIVARDSYFVADARGWGVGVIDPAMDTPGTTAQEVRARGARARGTWKESTELSPGKPDGDSVDYSAGDDPADADRRSLFVQSIQSTLLESGDLVPSEANTSGDALHHLDVIDQRMCDGSPTDSSGRPCSTGCGCEYEAGAFALGAVVHVLDTGCDRCHAEFRRPGVSRAACENDADNADNTSRASHGYNAMATASPPESPDDVGPVGHGTHVASTAAGKRAGPAREATIRCSKAIADDGVGSYLLLYKACDAILAEAAAAASSSSSSSVPRVVVMSLGAAGVNSDAGALLSKLADANISTFVAAGNEAIAACLSWPAQSDWGVAVGAIKSYSYSRLGEIFAYSNYGEGRGRGSGIVLVCSFELPFPLVPLLPLPPLLLPLQPSSPPSFSEIRRPMRQGVCARAVDARCMQPGRDRTVCRGWRRDGPL